MNQPEPPADRRAAEREPTLSVLLVEADQLAAERLFEVLGAAPAQRFEITHVQRIEEGLQKLHAARFDVLLLDLAIEESVGLESLHRARVAADTLPIVMLTYQGDADLALRATRAGAHDVLIKGESTPALIARSLVHAVERYRMMAELREAKQRHWFLANHDPLTALKNRTALLESARTALARAQRHGEQLAVFFLDLDGFKPVNDNLGHATGDELLIDVAKRLQRIRPKRDVVARFGGDEFVVVAMGVTDREAAIRLAEALRDEIERPYHVGGAECFISASVGVALFPEDGTDADELIRRADTAMYAAKDSGRNAVRSFENAMDEETHERFELVNGLREAIRAGDLVLEFQPQIDVVQERIVGAETLVRWQHVTRGLVAPNEFIGLAEDTGMMVGLGEWILRSACIIASGWTSLPDIRVAVNISGRQLEQRDFPSRVRGILDESGLAPGRLELELTESVAAQDSAMRALAELHEAGIRVAIDDFGTGYSSLALLKQLPADLLKIDQSFVHDAVSRNSGAVILDAIVRMARGLDLEVVAEGVETLEEMDLLLGLGCHQLQGYLLGKPTPKSDFESAVTAPDATWRLPIERPEAWSPLSREELLAKPSEPEILGDDALPVLK
ncbi:MAG: EAL domain-containing protein [bacterium]|nr:EAL domain-containing protein [bacterium]